MESIKDIITKNKETIVNHLLSPQEQEGTAQPNSKPVSTEATPEIKCQICRDGHFVHPRKPDGTPDYSRFVSCKCVKDEWEKQKKINLLKYCELPPKGQDMTFEKFKVTPPLKKAYDACLLMAEEKYPYSWITLMSESGRGKTHLALAVCNRWLARQHPAKYTYVPFLLEELKAGFKEVGDDSYQNRYDTFLNASLLVMDDLGTENPTPWAQEHLDAIFDYRLMHKLATIITTNLPYSRIPFRIASRLKRDGEIFVIDAPEFGGKK